TRVLDALACEKVAAQSPAGSFAAERNRTRPSILPRPSPGGGTGRHSRLKICRPHGHGSSILPLGTTAAGGAVSPAMNFCNNCGSRVAHRIPPGDHLPRFLC